MLQRSCTVVVLSALTAAGLAFSAGAGLADEPVSEPGSFTSMFRNNPH